MALKGILAGCVALCLTAGCAAPQPVQRPVARGPAELAAELYNAVNAPLRAFEQESPASCASPNLKSAADLAVANADFHHPANARLQDLLRDGGWVLDVADSALRHGCKDTARTLYAKVMKSYVGADYAALRERASAGLREAS